MDVKAAYLPPKIDKNINLELPKNLEKLESNGSKFL